MWVITHSYLIIGIFFAVLLIVPATSEVFAQTGDSVQIPKWIKFSAKDWSEGTTSDQEFADALEFLIKEKIIQSPSITVLDVAPSDVTQEKTQVVIPDWIKFNAQVWSDGEITDSDFAKGIEYLIKEEIIRSPKIQIGDGSGPRDKTDLDAGTGEDYGKLLELLQDLIEEERSRAEEPLTTDERIASATNQQTDSDLDGISDYDEAQGTLGYQTNSTDPDTDGDGLNDLREYWWNTNPTSQDSNGDFILDGESITDPDLRIYPYASLDKSKDFDGDGIPTAAERFDTLTSFKDVSTDGDRYGDGMEFFGISTKEDFLPKYVPADPLYPATPDIRITIDPDVKFLPGTTLEVGGRTLEKESYTMTNSLESKDAFSYGLSASVTAKSTMSTKLDDNKASVTFKAKADTEVRHTSTWTQSTESQLMTASEAYTIRSTKLGENTKLQMWFKIENVGDDLLTEPLKELIFNFYLGNENRFFHTQSITEAGVNIASYENLEPGETVEASIKIPLNLEQAKRFLANEAVRVEVAHYSFGVDEEYLINAKASNLQLVIVSQSGIDSRYVYLPTAMNLVQVLEAANIDYQRDATGIFSSIGNMDMQTDTPPYKTLEIHHTTDTSANSSPISSVDDMSIKKGDILVIKHIIDTDGDFLTDLEELAQATDPTKVDTDGDGLWDGYYDDKGNVGELSENCEITVKNPRGITNPLLEDTDADETPDGEEVQNGTDPCAAPSILSMGTLLHSPKRLESPNESFSLYMQEDGNLVVYENGKPLWASGTFGKGSPPYVLAMQEDGNLVVYGKDVEPVWHLNSAKKGSPPYVLAMQDDGNLVVYGNWNEESGTGVAIWSSLHGFE